MNINTIFISKGFVKVPTVKVVNADNNSMKENVSYEQMFGQDSRVALMIQTELMRFGYILSPEAFAGVKMLLPNEQMNLAKDIAAYFKNLYGDGQYTTLFGDYPNTVLSMDLNEWFCKQIWHYWSSCFRDLGIVDETYDPNPHDENDAEHLPSTMAACCRDEYKTINVGSADDIADIVKTLVGSQQSLVDFDKNVVKSFYENIDTIGLSPLKRVEMLDIDIPFKETLCIVASTCEFFNIKDITDVLRVACYMSGIDIALAPIPTKVNLGWSTRALTDDEKRSYHFKHFNNKEKRTLMSAIEDIINKKGSKAVLADMKKYLGRWIRIGEILHPASEKNRKKYPRTADVFSVLRNAPDTIVTWQAKIESLKKAGKFYELVDKLAERPGEFFRQIDYLVRTYNTRKDYIIETLLKIVPNIKTKMCYELLDHFMTRTKLQTSRTVMIKGARKPVELPLLQALDKDTVDKIQAVILNELTKRFKMSLDKNYGDLTGYKIYLSEDLSGIFLPKNMRSANNAAIQVARGTKMKLPEKCKCIRFFLHWKDDNGTEDLDLSAILFDENLRKNINVGWNSNWRIGASGLIDYRLIDYRDSEKANNDTCIVFSGDVRHRRGNNAEYIDVDIDAIARAGYRYIVLNGHDFNAHCFRDGYIGYMARAEFGTPGEVTWAPSTVENCIKLSSTTQSVTLGVIDTFERKFIYIDEDVNGIPVTSANGNRYEALVKRYTESQFFTGLTLLQSYFTMSDADDIIIKNENDIKNMVNEHNKTMQDLTHKLEQTKSTLNTYIKNMDNAGLLYDGNYIDELRSTIKTVEESLDNSKKKLFFTFDDMSNYSSIMKFMFE